MSQPPDPLPPLPVLPLPPEPVYPPAHPADAYAPMRAGRPGVISFMAVTSIVIGSLSILASAGFAFMDFGLLVSSTAITAASSIKTTPVAAIAATAERLPFSGLGAADRETFADGLQRVRPLTADQLLQLDELLAEQGRIIAGQGAMLAPEQLAASISKSGHLSSTDGGGSDYFDLGNGRLEIFADRAVFFPTGGQPSIHGNAYTLPQPTNGYPPTSLQPDQIRSILRTVNDLNGTKIKSAQAKVLINTLQSSGEQFIIPTTDGTDPAFEITAVTTGPDGTLDISTTHGFNNSNFSCDPSGSTVSQSSSSTAITTPTGPVVNKTAGLTVLSLTASQLLLGIFLLVTGILTLRFSPRGRLLHWIYVTLKLPLGIATAAVSFWMWTSMMQSAMASMPAGPGAPPPAAAATGSAVAGAMFGLIPAALGCLWPVVLIFILPSRNVRMYYAAGAAK